MSQIVSYLDLSVYPIIALVFFLAAFLGIVWRVMTRPQHEIDDAAEIVLHDDRVIAPRRPLTRSTPNHDENKGAGRG